MWDVVVAGAGPAGAVAAATLVRGGYRTLLVDRFSEGRKIGEALPGAAVRLLRALGLPAPEAGGPHTAIGGTLSSWNSEALSASDAIRDPYGPGWRLDRQRFDADLRDAALAAGAIFRADHVHDLQRRDDCWEMRFGTTGTERARWVIDATGRRAAIARRLGMDRIRDRRLIAFYAVGRADAGLQLDRTLIEAAPEGWWYAARLPSGAPVAGFHTDARKAAHLSAEPDGWVRELSRTNHMARLFDPALFNTPPSSHDARGARLVEFSGDGWIACGDAAMCFDPVSGQGIFSALHSGQAAAAAIIAALGGNAAARESYSTQMDDVWNIYRQRVQAIYRSERRWPDAAFWSCACG